MSQNITLAQLAAQIVVDGCIPLADEAPLRGNLPVQGVQLDKVARAKLEIHGATPEGRTLFFGLGGNGVFWDLSSGVATVWFKGADVSSALGEFEKALKRTYPKHQFIEEQQHPDYEDLRVRAYIVELTPPKLVSLEVAHTAAGARSPEFTVRVRAFKKPNCPWPTN